MFNPVKSRVTPDGTARAERTIVAQAALDLLARAAPLEPEKVHVPLARLSNSAGSVGAGAAAPMTWMMAEMPQTIRIVETQSMGLDFVVDKGNYLAKRCAGLEGVQRKF